MFIYIYHHLLDLTLSYMDGRTHKGLFVTPHSISIPRLGLLWTAVPSLRKPSNGGVNRAG